MTIDEIDETFDKRRSNLNRLERFLFNRKSQILENIKDSTYMVLSASPTFMRDEITLDIHDENLRRMMLNASGISCGQPYTTIDGLKADQHTPYYYPTRSNSDYLEVFSNGYMEFGKYLRGDGQYGIYLGSRAEILLIISFTKFIKDVYERYFPFTPILVTLSVFNAKGIWLSVTRWADEDRQVRWQEQHLELGNFYAQDISNEYKLLNKKICDRVWQAFNRDGCDLFDDAGTLRESR